MDQILDATGAGRAEAIERAVAALLDGELVVLPTDTLYGLAADAFNQGATRRVFVAKERSHGVPLPVLVRSPKQLAGLCADVPVEAERLMAAWWPGPVTLVLPCAPGLMWDLGDAGGTVAVRMPLDDVALAVIRGVGPLAVTSANRSGQPPAATARAALDQLGAAVRHYLDDGPRAGGVASTVVDLTRAAPAILRSGAIPDERVLAVAEGRLDPLEAASWPEPGEVPGGDDR